MSSSRLPGASRRLIPVIGALLLAASIPTAATGAAARGVDGQGRSGIAPAAEQPGDVVACDAGDPDFGTNCEYETEDTELRDSYLDSRQIPGDVITSGDVLLAAQQAAATTTATNGLVDPNWHLVGPANVGGRVTDIAPDPTSAGTVYVAVATSGLWK